MLLRVLKTNGTGRYYSSIIENRQYVLAFSNYKAANKCRQFVTEHKKRFSCFPRINLENRVLHMAQDDLSDTHVYIDEDAEDFMIRCAMHNMYIAELSFFDYTYENDVFSVDLTTSRILYPSEEYTYSINTLNSLL
jgi:hypothetical protein